MNTPKSRALSIPAVIGVSVASVVATLVIGGTVFGVLNSWNVPLGGYGHAKIFGNDDGTQTTVITNGKGATTMPGLKNNAYSYIDYQTAAFSMRDDTGTEGAVKASVVVYSPTGLGVDSSVWMQNKNGTDATRVEVTPAGDVVIKLGQ